MRAVVVAGLLLAACSGDADSPGGDARHPEDAAAAAQWRLEQAAESATLILASGAAPEIRIICSATGQQLSVNVPDFKPIGSEERLSFGQSGEVVALVADVRGDSARGGVTGSSSTPDNLEQLLAGPVAASYGAQTSGPHPTPPPELASEFARACSSGSGGSGITQAKAPSASACLTSRDGEPVPENAIKGVGTEPFWAVTVEGRCVTYSHPEDQSGTRVWTSFSGTASSGNWTGSLGGQPFVMKTRPQPGCSDGMSDEVYPIAVSLSVGGEQRSGCARPR